MANNNSLFNFYVIGNGVLHDITIVCLVKKRLLNSTYLGLHIQSYFLIEYFIHSNNDTKC